jgi:hypothetical protein
MQYLSSVILHEVSCHLIYNNKVDLDATILLFLNVHIGFEKQRLLG